MIQKKLLVSLVATFALLLVLVNSASALSTISVEINGIDAENAQIAAFAGQVLPVRVTFNTSENATDVRVNAWFVGSKDNSVVTERFDVIAGNIYTRTLSVQVPSDINPEEKFKLVINIESKDGKIFDRETILIEAQRENYNVEILDAEMASKVKAGDNLAVDIVLKNRGRHIAEDTFVRAKITSLGIAQKAYFGDLTPVDQTDDNQDAVDKRMYLSIPSDAPTGIYTVEFEVYNTDSSSVISKKIEIVGIAEDTLVVPSVTSKTIGVGQQTTYSLTIVNSGSKVRVYQLIADAPTGLTVSVEEPVIAIPAGSSKTVNVDATAQNSGTYSFTVSVNSDNALVQRKSFTANAEGKQLFAGNAAVLLTVILAIIFVVLLVVLIVLLTRKPQKSEEFGESYY